MDIGKMKYLHHPGGSCACVAWSGVFKKHGINLSESDVFGLGSGIYFGYCAVGSSKLFDISLTSSGIVSDLFINTGAYGKLFQISYGHKCLDLIFNSIDRGFPVAVELNPYYCEGLIKITPSHLHQYLPAHWIVITGYDLNRKTITTYDNRQFNPIEIPIDKFIKGRETGLFDQNPRNFYYNVFFFDKLYPLDVSVQLSLRKACINYLNVEKILSFYTGQYGFEKWERQIKVWNGFFKDETQLKQLLQKIKISITGAGGIKGGYRNLFSKYLIKANDVMGNTRFVDISNIFKESADYWNILSNKLNDYSPGSDNNYWGSNSELSKIVGKIKGLETKGFSEILKIIN
jgi:hypothetical protein